MQSMNKKKKEPGIIETIKQVNQRDELKKQERFEKKNEQEREKYGKENAREKKEVLKVRQGVINESELLAPEGAENRQYTFRQKFGNFIYHNKWWLGITVFIVIIASFLIYDTLTTIRSDIRVMLLSDNDSLQEHINDIKSFFDENTEDYNEDDRNYTDIVFIPVSHNMEENMQSAYGYENSLTNLSTQFQLSECMLVLGDSAADELIEPENTLENLEAYFPDNPNVDGCKFYLKNTDFAEKIGLKSSDIPDDLYLSVRRVMKNLSTEETGKTNHEHAVATIKKIVRQLK